MPKLLEKALNRFREDRHIFNIGALGTVLIITRKAKRKGLPLDTDELVTAGGGQVSGLSGQAIGKILKEHGLDRQVGTESGRTSRGTPKIAKEYAALLNELEKQGIANLETVERWWVQRFEEYFNREPFKLNYDRSKSLASIIQSLLAQATDRQKKSPGKTYLGTVLQHLIGAKLELALPEAKIEHHGSSVADAVSDRSGDFTIDNVVIHCTTAPTSALLQKCKSNLQAAKRPMILTVAKMVGAAESMADSLDIEGRVEIMDAVQFIAVNLYEMSTFKASQREIALHRLLERYNEIISSIEKDQSLLVELG